MGLGIPPLVYNVSMEIGRSSLRHKAGTEGLVGAAASREQPPRAPDLARLLVRLLVLLV